MYTASVLTLKSASYLKWVLRGSIGLPDGYEFMTPNGDPLPHHMTVNMGEIDTKLNPVAFMDHFVILTVDQIVHSPKVGAVAARVSAAKMRDTGEEIKSTNKHPHITICLAPGVKPFASNKVFEAEDKIEHDLFGELIQLQAVFTQCP